MKNEIKIDTSKNREKNISAIRNEHQFFFDEPKLDQNNFRDRNHGFKVNYDEQIEHLNRTNHVTSASLIPPLMRIGSDKSSSSHDERSSSTYSLSKRRPVGNLTPTKFEYLQSSDHKQITPTVQKTDQSNLIGNNQKNEIHKTFDQLNDLNKEQSNSLNSIQSTDLSVKSAISNKSSNRSSPDLPNQRSHCSTTYLNKHNAFDNHFKPAYSSSNLFDSIQHLDITKLIATSDRARLFCSTSTLPTISSGHSVLVPKNAKTAGFINASSIYGQFLIVICLVLFTAEIRTTELPLHYFEAFFFYLYSISIIFLFYVFFYLLKGVKSSELRSRENKFKKDKVSENEKSHGSIFLRIGCIAFGLGTTIYCGLELGSYFELGQSSPCHSIYLLLNPLLQAIFTFCQMYFIFTYSRLMINKFKLIARIGLIHLVATNICTWIKILLKETLQTLHLNEAATSHATLEELILPLKIDLKHHNGTLSSLQKLVNSSNPCMKENIMGTILSDISPYLYPFIIEYSLIGAAFIYVFWSNIGRLSNLSFPNVKSNLPLNAQHLHHHSNKKADCPHLNNQKQNDSPVHETTINRQSRSISPSLSVNHLNNLDNNATIFNASQNQIETNSSSCSPTNQTTNTSITPTSNSNLISNIQCTPPNNRSVLMINTHQMSGYGQSNGTANVVANNSNALLLDNISTGSSRDSCNGKFSGGQLSYQVNSMYANNLNMIQSTQSLYSCLGSSKGLFCGFLFLVISIILLIIFFVLSHHNNYRLIASLVNEGSHSVLLVLSTISTIVAFFKVRKLKFKPGVNDTADSGLREILLKVAAFGLFTYSLFGLIAGLLNVNNIQNIAVIITSTLSIIQVALQSLFISDIVCRKRCNSRQQVPQQIITFLMITNLIFWILYTFEMQKVEASPVQLEVYGQLTWALIVRITLPLSIFYRDILESLAHHQRKQILDILNQQNKDNLKMDLSNHHGSHGAKKFYREINHRVFVNRSLHLEKIKFFGFDMDYTLAEYISPHLEAATFRLIIDRLISMGYPAAIADFEYDSKFPVRGLWFDTTHGNFLKVDPYGNILVCVHGFKFLKTHEIYDLYPNKFVQLNESRIYILNSLFDQPETYLLACIVDYFSNSKEFTKTPDGVKKNEDNLFMPYKGIFQDVRSALDWVHDQGALKCETLSKLEKYVMKDERLPQLFERMRDHGKKIFLLTNSDYQYTNKIMDFLFSVKSANGRKWTEYFDYIVVDARKPLFFSEGTILRQVDTTTGALKIGAHVGPIESGRVYSGGSCDVFTQLIGAKGRDVLYVGDHIFGDILKSKKKRGWRTFLVIPELQHELEVWEKKTDLFVKLQVLDIQLGDLYKDLDSSTNIKPDLTTLRTQIRETIHQMDMSYGILGSLFRCGSRQTHFANQVTRFADIYASTCLNLFYYPFCYMFRAPAMLMSHESTIGHDRLFDIPSNLSLTEALNHLKLTKQSDLSVSPALTVTDKVQEKKSVEEKKQKAERKDSQVPHPFPETPTEITHDADFDSDEQDSN